MAMIYKLLFNTVHATNGHYTYAILPVTQWSPIFIVCLFCMGVCTQVVVVGKSAYIIGWLFFVGAYYPEYTLLVMGSSGVQIWQVSLYSDTKLEMTRFHMYLQSAVELHTAISKAIVMGFLSGQEVHPY